MSEQNQQAIIWQFCDGKAGHERQSSGLVRALQEKLRVASFRLETADVRVSALDFMRRKFRHGDELPDPDFIVGAGRACQIPMLLAQRARGGHTVYLMNPALPRNLFTLCLVPRHDGVKPSSRIIVTEGVLNDLIATDTHGNLGLVLIGGPSKHYGWDDDDLFRQINRVIADTGHKKWIIADSRRTPTTTAASIGQLTTTDIEIVHHRDASQAWLADCFASSDCIWVTRDSVSMLYESLSCGAGVGVLNVPLKRKSRVTSVVDDLGARGMVTLYDSWHGGLPTRNSKPLAEAARCADLIAAQWQQRDSGFERS